jgi:hypothetical protein
MQIIHRFTFGFWLFLGLFYAVICAAPAAQANDYLSLLGDVPLAEGLAELPDAGIVFDKPQGRIVQITASHNRLTTRTKLIEFYKDSLPNLGWQARAAENSILTFERQGEILRLTFTADLVIFDLAPRAAP